MGTLSIFCDESHPVKHDGASFFVIGCVYCGAEKAEKASSDLVRMKAEHGYSEDYEVKWSEINGKNLPLIKEIVSYLAESDDLMVRALVATNKDESIFKFALRYQPFYEKMYILMLKKIFSIQGFHSTEEMRLFVDRRNTHSEEEAKRVCGGIAASCETNLKKLRYKVVDSKKTQLIQMADIIVGSIAYERTAKGSASGPKREVLELIKRKMRMETLNRSTRLGQRKFNVFVWEGTPLWKTTIEPQQ